MISVCIATYNGEKYIKSQIKSILEQLDKDDEIVISDDGSTDDTLKIISSFKDKRIKVLNHQKNPELLKKKYCRSFYLVTDNYSNAISASKGDYIFLSDQDDIWVKNRKNKVLEQLEKYDCVMCNYNVIDENDNVIANCYNQTKPYKSSFLYNLIFVPFLGCCMAFSRECMKYVFPFPKNLFAHDLWIGLLACQRKRMTYINEPLHNYRKHQNNVSPATGKTKNRFFFMIYYRIVILLQCIKRRLGK